MREFTIKATTAIKVRPEMTRTVREDDGTNVIEVVHSRSVLWTGLAEFVDPVSRVVSERKSYAINADNATTILPADLAEYVIGRYPTDDNGPTVAADPAKSAAVVAHLRSLTVLPVASGAEDALI